MSRFFKSHGFQVGLSLALAAGFSAIFLRKVDLGELAHAIASSSPGWLLVSLALGLSTFLLRAARWIWILRPVGGVPFIPAFRATAVGFAANTVLPARAGEVLRPALLARERRLPFSALLASIAFERILDAVSQLLFLVIAIVEGPPAGAPAEAAALSSSGKLRLVALLVLLAAVGVSLFAVLWRETTERAFESAFRVLPEAWRSRARRIAHTFLDGFASLKKPRLLLMVAGGSLLMWFVINLQIYAVLRAFHLDLPLSASFVVTTAAVLGVAVPTPGGIGSYQAAVQYALMHFYAVPRATASGVAILAWATSFIAITLVGFAMFAAMPMRKDRLGELAVSGDEALRR